MENLFRLPIGPPGPDERFEPLARSEDVLIERIVSHGHATPPGTWYDQDRDEWVALLQGHAVIAFEDGETLALAPGDWLAIPAHRRHRVEATSADPPCIWLAVHGRLG